MQTDVTLVPIRPEVSTHTDEVERICSSLAGIDPWRRLNISVDRLTNGLLQPKMGAESFFIQAHGDAVGVLTLQSPWLFGVYIQLFAILPRSQGSGVGRAVIRLIEKYAHEKHCGNIWLCVSKFNESAESFYQALGFEPVGNLTGLIVPNEDEILMRRILVQQSDDSG